jgi:hypothetical protein
MAVGFVYTTLIPKQLCINDAASQEQEFKHEYL